MSFLLHPPPARDFHQCVVDLDCALSSSNEGYEIKVFGLLFTLKVGIAKEKELESEVRSESLVFIDYFL